MVRQNLLILWSSCYILFWRQYVSEWVCMWMMCPFLPRKKKKHVPVILNCLSYFRFKYMTMRFFIPQTLIAVLKSCFWYFHHVSCSKTQSKYVCATAENGSNKIERFIWNMLCTLKYILCSIIENTSADHMTNTQAITPLYEKKNKQNSTFL